MTGGCDRQTRGRREVKFPKFSSCLTVITLRLHYKYVPVNAVWRNNRFYTKNLSKRTYNVCVYVCVHVDQKLLNVKLDGTYSNHRT